MSSGDAPSTPLGSVGTDVVDLAHPRCAGKASHARFLDRVLTDAERRRVEAALRGDAGGASGSPGRAPASADAPASPELVSPADLVLWRIWALKEAAFKAMTGVLGTPPVFEHRAFEVRFGVARESGPVSRPGDRDPGPLDAVVRWRDRSVAGRIARTRASGPVHALACVERDGRAEPSPYPGTGAGTCWSPDRVRWARALLPADAQVPVDRFTDRERRSVHSVASAQVRLHARRDLAEWAGVAEAELEIVCDEGPVGRMPPRVLHRGEPAPWSVGLSHHGRWLAWVLARWDSQGPYPDR